MNIYKISQSVNVDWDTYDSAVVYAESEEAAKLIHPSGNDCKAPSGHSIRDGAYGCWTSEENITVELLGSAINSAEQGVIVASFNAG